MNTQAEATSKILSEATDNGPSGPGKPDWESFSAPVAIARALNDFSPRHFVSEGLLRVRRTGGGLLNASGDLLRCRFIGR